MHTLTAEVEKDHAWLVPTQSVLETTTNAYPQLGQELRKNSITHIQSVHRDKDLGTQASRGSKGMLIDQEQTERVSIFPLQVNNKAIQKSTTLPTNFEAFPIEMQRPNYPLLMED